VAALFAFAARLTAVAADRSTPARVAALSAVGLLLLDRLFQLREHSLADLFSPRARSIAVVVHLFLGLAVLAFLALRPMRRARFALLALIWLEAGLLVTQAQLAPAPRSLPFHRHGFDRLAAEIEARRRPGDRLFVWGWAPEIYSLTRMEAASHFSICQYIVNDYEARPAAPRLDPYLADLLMRDLERRRPRFVVDAARRSWTMSAGGVPWLYRLDLYPDFALRTYLARGYRRVGTFDGCDLYLRKATGS
jgi:hypothetical protein